MLIIKIFKFLVPVNSRVELVKLTILLIIGLVFELIGLGLIIPIMSIIVKPHFLEQYPQLKSIMDSIGNPGQKQLILLGFLSLVLLYTIKTIFLIFLSWKQSKFSSSISFELSNKLFQGYLKMPYSFHLTRNSADLLRNIQTEVGQFNSIIQSIINLSTELTFLTGIIFLLFFIEPIAATVVASFLATSAFIFHRLTRNILLNWGKLRLNHEGISNKFLLQGLSAVKDIKIFGRELFFVSNFSFEKRIHLRIVAKQFTLQQTPRLYLELLSILGLSGMVVIMIAQNKDLNLLLPTLAVFMAATFRVIPSINKIMSSVQNLRYAQPVVDVLCDEVQLINNQYNDDIKINQLSFKSKIRLENVSFKYENSIQAVLKNVNIEISKGDSIGIVGLSGSGKSTLIDIILGLHKPISGSVFVDGQDINNSIRAWQDIIGYVPQTIYLIDDSIKNNIAFGISENEIDKLKLVQAIKAAQLEEFIENLPEGVDSMVGERGVRLSGGQRQRIGIARALYNDPQILILDEATSSLDNSTELEVMNAVNELKGNKTLIIIAHRTSTIEKCNKIFKVFNGKVEID